MAAIKPLCAELQKVAIEELGEVPDRIPEDLRTLVTWIEQQPHLNARMDHQFLIQFLRGCKYSLEKAKKKIDNFHTLRKKYANILTITDVDNSTFRGMHNTGTLTVLPTPLNGSGPRIIMIRFLYSVDKYRFEDAIQICTALNEVLIDSDPYACICGVAYVLDMTDATANHFLQFTPSILKCVIPFYENTLPLRIKRVCFINAGPAAVQFLNFLLPFFSEKLRKRISVCGKDFHSLKDMPLKYLPQEYGGSNGSLNQLTKDYNMVWDEYREYFKQNADYGTDERLRPGDSKDTDGVFGVGGSFRKIDLD